MNLVSKLFAESYQWVMGVVMVFSRQSDGWMVRLYRSLGKKLNCNHLIIRGFYIFCLRIMLSMSILARAFWALARALSD